MKVADDRKTELSPLLLLVCGSQFWPMKLSMQETRHGEVERGCMARIDDSPSQEPIFSPFQPLPELSWAVGMVYQLALLTPPSLGVQVTPGTLLAPMSAVMSASAPG